jgi:glycosyltransferase involved in cell wall biosynthesis
VGSGTRLKILEAWAMGKAVLSTALGAEGLPARDGENILIADTPERFAERAVALLEDAGSLKRLGGAGRQVVEETFSWKRIGDRLLEAYEATLAGGRRSTT